MKFVLTAEAVSYIESSFTFSGNVIFATTYNFKMLIFLEMVGKMVLEILDLNLEDRVLC